MSDRHEGHDIRRTTKVSITDRIGDPAGLVMHPPVIEVERWTIWCRTCGVELAGFEGPAA